MSAGKTYDWKVLAIGRGNQIAAGAEEYLRKMGFPNSTALAIENNQASDDRVLELLKNNEWDGISIGGGLNGYDDHHPREIATLYWMNRLINLIHEHAPKAKFIFVKSPGELPDGFVRVLGSNDQAPPSV